MRTRFGSDWSVDFPHVAAQAERHTARAMARVQTEQRAHVRLLGWLLALSVGAGLVLGLLFLRNVLRAVETLKEGAVRIGAGDLEHRVVINGEDELSEVAERFNWMAMRLGQSNAELRMRCAELVDTLERVQSVQPEGAQNQKMNALGVMLAGLAHELNNPLASVVGFGELIQDRMARARPADLPSIGRELVVPLVSEAVRARDLVRTLLQFARSADNTPRAVALEDVIQPVVRLRAYAFAQAGLELHLQLEPGLTVHAEPQRLQQVFLNLINNAFDALRDAGGSRLTIAAQAAEAGWVEIVVADDGPGLRDPERVFEPFYTTKPVGGGTGLGLALAHQFVRDVGGSITASNEGGAVFRIRMRSVQSAPQRESRRNTAGATESPRRDAWRQCGAGLRVLVVDDEPALRQLQKRILADAQFEVLLAASGAEARDCMLRVKVDVVISDVKMPGELDGVALFAWVEEHNPALAERFLFVTGDVHSDETKNIYSQCADRFLLKPFRIDEYMERVAAVIRRRAHGSSGEACVQKVDVSSPSWLQAS